MKKLILAGAVVAAFSGSFAQAQEAAAPDHQFAFNVGATSDYRFRGISQTRGGPAVFGGADYTHTPTGLYFGAWASTIRWIKDLGGNSSYELDIYGGKRGEVAGLSYDVGLIRYFYPDNKLPVSTVVSGLSSANTTEAYLQVGYGIATLKYSYALTDFIGWGFGTDGSDYIDLSVNPEIADGYVLNLHVGKQTVKNYVNTTTGANANYTDWKVGVTKDFGVVVGALAVVGTNADKNEYNFGGRRYLGDTKVLATITKNF